MRSPTLHRIQFRREIIQLVLVAALAACGPADTPPPTPTDTPTPAPPTPTALPPTWTPSPVPPTATRVQRTPPPTVTQRPSVTPPPQPTTGVQHSDDTWRVTVVTADLNTAITTLAEAQADRPLAAPPVITLDYGARVAIDLVLNDALLDQESQVQVVAQVLVEGGRLRLRERREERRETGMIASDTSVRAALALVEDGMLAAIMAVAGTTPATHQVIDARVYPDRLEVTLRPVATP